MRKLTILLLSFLFVGLGNVIAQTEATVDTKTEEVKKECPYSKTDANSGATKCCKSKKKSCCKSKNKGCSGKKGKYSSGTNSGFNFGKKSSCSKSVKKWGENCVKACCTTEKSSDDDNDDSDDDNGGDEDSNSDE